MGASERLDEAARTPFVGWDFSWLGDRFRETGPAWDFGALADAAIAGARPPLALDMGTGGGEWLGDRVVELGAPPSRPVIVASEAWGPNVPVAGAHLAAHGVPVVQDEGAVDNLDQAGSAAPGGRLPFRTGAFGLVTNRHEAFVATEVARVLAPGGAFLTQQADAGRAGFADLLGLAPPARHPFRRADAEEQLVAAGLAVTGGASGHVELRFADVGAVAWYLLAVPWAVPGFDLEQQRSALLALDGRPLVVVAERFWLSAVAPS